jgi:CheY-like chemotaxis protein
MRTVLVIDDNTDGADSLGELLSATGFTVFIATDGPTGLATAGAVRPDAIVLDLRMPGMDGYAVCRKLRQEAWCRDIAIIAVSGMTRPCDRQAALDAGCDAYLKKPHRVADLIALIEKPISRAQ